jgi:hypothetical protein
MFFQYALTIQTLVSLTFCKKTIAKKRWTKIQDHFQKNLKANFGRFCENNHATSRYVFD